MSIISEAFRNEAVSLQHSEAQRMMDIIKQIESNPELFQACVAQLSPEQNNALQEAYKNIVNVQAQ